MNIYLTEIRAVSPYSKEICIWGGPNISAKTVQEAQNYCNSHGLGYCRVIGKLVDVIGIKESNICLN